MNVKVLSLLGISAAFAAGIATLRYSDVRIEGKFATSDTISKNGKTYVPLGDVAKALGYTVSKTSTGYDLVKAGGANQVQGVSGKIGDMLFNGRYRFQVVKVIRTSDYKPQFTDPGFNFTPTTSSHEIVAIVCKLKNATKESQTVDITAGDNTALTDDQGRSYGCARGVSIDMEDRAPKLLPGAAVDFALTFEAPKNAKLQDLVYSIQDFSSAKMKDFRVSLGE
jgi:hypothetical protein